MNNTVLVISDDEEQEQEQKKRKIDHVNGRSPHIPNFVNQHVQGKIITNGSKNFSTPSSDDKLPLISPQIIELYTLKDNYNKAKDLFEKIDQGLYTAHELIASVPDRGAYYRVRIAFGQDSITRVQCTCTTKIFYCAHVSALLLLLVHKPQRIYHIHTFRSLIDSQNSESLKAMLLAFLQRPTELSGSLHDAYRLLKDSDVLARKQSSIMKCDSFETILSLFNGAEINRQISDNVANSDQKPIKNFVDLYAIHEFLRGLPDVIKRTNKPLHELYSICFEVIKTGENILRYGDVENGFGVIETVGSYLVKDVVINSSVPRDIEQYYNALAKLSDGLVANLLLPHVGPKYRESMALKIKSWLDNNNSQEKLKILKKVLDAPMGSQAIEKVFEGDRQAIDQFSEAPSLLQVRLMPLLERDGTNNKDALRKACYYCQAMKRHLLAAEFMMKLEDFGKAISYAREHLDIVEEQIYFLLLCMLYLIRNFSGKMEAYNALLSNQIIEQIDGDKSTIHKHNKEVFKIIFNEDRVTITALVHAFKERPNEPSLTTLKVYLEALFDLYQRTMQSERGMNYNTTAFMVPFLGVINKVQATYNLVKESKISAENRALLANLFENWHNETGIAFELSKGALLESAPLLLDAAIFAIKSAVKLQDQEPNTAHVNSVATILIERSSTEDVNTLWECITELSKTDRYDDECFSITLKLLFLSLQKSLKDQVPIDALVFEFCLLQALTHQTKKGPEASSVKTLLSILMNTLRVDTFENRWQVFTISESDECFDYDSYNTKVTGNVSTLSNWVKFLSDTCPTEALALSEYCMAIIMKRPIPKRLSDISNLTIPESVINITCSCASCTDVKKFLRDHTQLKIKIPVKNQPNLVTHLVQKLGVVKKRTIDPVICRLVKDGQDYTFYEITKNLEHMEAENLNKERNTVEEYINHINSVLFAIMLSAVKLDLAQESLQRADGSYVQQVLTYISENSLRNPFIAIRIVSFLWEQGDQGYHRLAEDLSLTISQNEYSNVNELPISIRFALAEIAKSCKKITVVLNYLTDIFDADPSFNCLLQLMMIYRDVKIPEEKWNETRKKLVGELAKKYHDYHEGKGESFHTNLIARNNLSRLKDHLHIMIGITQDIGMAYYLVSNFDPDSHTTILDILNYEFLLMKQYQISAQKVEDLYKEALIQFHKNLMNMDSNIMNMELFRAVNQLYLTIAKCGYTQLAMTLGKDRTQFLLANMKLRIEEVLIPWLSTFAMIYQLAGMAANGSYESFLKNAIYPALSTSPQMLKVIQNTSCIHPRTNSVSASTLVDSPYRTDVPKPIQS